MYSKPRKRSKGVQRVLIEERLKRLKTANRRLNLAIRSKCQDCCGGIKSEIGKCTVKKCALWKIIKKGELCSGKDKQKGMVR